MQNFLCGLGVVVCVALQDLLLGERILHRNQRRILRVFGADKEYERFQNTLCAKDIPYNLTKLYGADLTDGKLHLTATVYSKSQKDSIVVKELLDSFETKSKYIVHEERVRL